jgi:hypothetical protein
MTYSYKFHPIPFIASYNRKCLPSECVEYVEELMLVYRTLELMNRVKELSLQHEWVLKHMGLLESIHKWCITNNLHNTPFIKDYEKRTGASQASMLQEHNLIKESTEIIERWEKIQGTTFQEVCLGDKPEKEHEDEGGKGHLPTTPTNHGKFLDIINAQLDDHLSYLRSIRASCMEPIETMLEYSPLEDIVRADVSKFIVRDELDIGIVPDVPPITTFEETPIGIHLMYEIAQKEGELLALREL